MSKNSLYSKLVSKFGTSDGKESQPCQKIHCNKRNVVQRWAETDYRPDVNKYIAREFWPHTNV